MSGFGEALRQLRDEKGLSQQDVASRAETSVMTVSKLERGLHAPSLRTRRKLAAALGMPPEEFARRVAELVAAASAPAPDEVSVKIPRELYAHAVEQAAEAGISPEAWIVKTIRPADQSARRPLTDTRTPPPTRGRGKTPRKRH